MHRPFIPIIAFAVGFVATMNAPAQRLWHTVMANTNTGEVIPSALETNIVRTLQRRPVSIIRDFNFLESTFGDPKIVWGSFHSGSVSRRPYISGRSDMSERTSILIGVTNGSSPYSSFDEPLFEYVRPVGAVREYTPVLAPYMTRPGSQNVITEAGHPLSLEYATDDTGESLPHRIAFRINHTNIYEITHGTNVWCGRVSDSEYNRIRDGLDVPAAETDALAFAAIEALREDIAGDYQPLGSYISAPDHAAATSTIWSAIQAASNSIPSLSGYAFTADLASATSALWEAVGSTSNAIPSLAAYVTKEQLSAATNPLASIAYTTNALAGYVTSVAFARHESSPHSHGIGTVQATANAASNRAALAYAAATNARHVANASSNWTFTALTLARTATNAAATATANAAAALATANAASNRAAAAYASATNTAAGLTTTSNSLSSRISAMTPLATYQPATNAIWSAIRATSNAIPSLDPYATTAAVHSATSALWGAIATVTSNSLSPSNCLAITSGSWSWRTNNASYGLCFDGEPALMFYFDKVTAQEILSIAAGAGMVEITFRSLTTNNVVKYAQPTAGGTVEWRDWLYEGAMQ